MTALTLTFWPAESDYYSMKNFSIPTSSFIAAFRLILQRLIGWFAISRRELPNPVLPSAKRFRYFNKIILQSVDIDAVAAQEMQYMPRCGTT